MQNRWKSTQKITTKSTMSASSHFSDTHPQDGEKASAHSGNSVHLSTCSGAPKDGIQSDEDECGRQYFRPTQTDPLTTSQWILIPYILRYYSTHTNMDEWQLNLTLLTRNAYLSFSWKLWWSHRWVAFSSVGRSFKSVLLTITCSCWSKPCR